MYGMHDIFSQMVRSLRQLDACMEKAVEYAKARGFEPDKYFGLRMAPDQFPFERQVQIACDALRLGVARITGTEAQPVSDSEKTIDELRARVKMTIEVVSAAKPAQFEGADKRAFTTPRWQGKTMTGRDYLIQHVVPNFHFHIVHAYALLRHAGVPLGKADYLGPLTMTAPGGA